ncbi:hypothetical protein WG929_08245 [Oceanobacter sp. wDCs-4]|uniref:Uncharacterized protein n=1 Tax=Oceanobacter antarcticus TaxID=3133425 RepID=A0ABW8NHF6_9GAMM
MCQQAGVGGSIKLSLTVRGRSVSTCLYCYWQKGNEEEANKAFAAALANLPLISRSSALTLVCQLSGVLESRPECAEVYASLLEKIALRRWIREHPAHFGDERKGLPVSE